MVKEIEMTKDYKKYGFKKGEERKVYESVADELVDAKVAKLQTKTTNKKELKDG